MATEKLKNMQETLKRYLDSYILRDGHYVHSTGKHSDKYIQARIALMKDCICECASEVAAEVIKLSAIKFNAVAAFTIGGILLAKKLREELKAYLGTYPNLVIGSNPRVGVEWHTIIQSDAKVLLVDDVANAKIRIATDALLNKQSGCDLVAVLILVDLHSKPHDKNPLENFPFKVLKCTDFTDEIIFPPSDCRCSLCDQGIPAKDLSNPDVGRPNLPSNIDRLLVPTW